MSAYPASHVLRSRLLTLVIGGEDAKNVVTLQRTICICRVRPFDEPFQTVPVFVVPIKIVLSLLKLTSHAARSRSSWRLSSLWLVQACWKASFRRAVSIKRDSLSQFGSALARTKVSATHRISSGVKTSLGLRKNFTQTRCEEWLVHNLVDLQLS
jgi:hypothetical protein